MWEQRQEQNESRQCGEKRQVLSGLAQPTCPDRLTGLGCALVGSASCSCASPQWLMPVAG